MSRVVLLLVAVAGGAAAGAALWSPAGELPPPDTAYTAVTPCVVFDSRATQGATGGFIGPINGGQAVTYDLTGTFPAGQGGNAPGATCGIPVGAAAVEINVVAVNALNEGNLRVTDGSPSVAGGVVNYQNLTPKLNTSNSVTIPLSPAGTIVVTPNCGAGCVADSTDVRGVVLGYFTNGLAQRLAAVETKLASMSLATVDGEPTVRFTGVNLQLLNGAGDTYVGSNGTGNLILGYNLNGLGHPRTGSHNLVIGDDNNWTGGGGAVVSRSSHVQNGGVVLGGSANLAGGSAVVAGGTFSSASNFGAFVAGGFDNVADGVGAAIVGGYSNEAHGRHALVAGGRDNRANAPAGGCDDQADATTSVGGRNNSTDGCYATASGGGASTSLFGNRATGPYATVSGGSNNAASSDFAVVSGGRDNQATAAFATVSGGRGRTAAHQDDWVGGTLVEDL